MLSCCSFGLRRIASLSSRSKTNTHTSGFSISARIPSAHDPALEILNGKLCQSTPYVDMLSHRLHGTHSCKAMSVSLFVLVVVVVWAWLFQGCISTRNPQCLVIAYQDLTDAAALQRMRGSQQSAVAIVAILRVGPLAASCSCFRYMMPLSCG